MKTSPARFQKVTRLPLRQLVREQLLELLTTGELAPGDDLSETQLSNALGVSRSPLREALLLLSQEGYIENIPNRGFFVPVPDPEKVAEVYTVLSQLECLALRLSWNGLAQQCKELERLNERVHAANLSGRARAAADRAFHQTLTELSGNSTLQDEIERLWIKGRLFDGALRRGLADPEESAGEHRAIIKCIQRDDLDGAVTALKNHWNVGIAVVRDWIERSRT